MTPYGPTPADFPTGNPSESYGLIFLGRASDPTGEWVVYSDGCYRHVVAADDWDRDDWPGDDPEAGIDHYTDIFCPTVLFADDDTALRIATTLGLTHVHSTDGTCSLLYVGD